MTHSKDAKKETKIQIYGEMKIEGTEERREGESETRRNEWARRQKAGKALLHEKNSSDTFSHKIR